MKGLIFDLQRFCVHDGDGIRTTVFFKGCILNCLWCHNPESKSKKPELRFIENKCIGCGECERVCKSGCHTFTNGRLIDRQKCNSCFDCVSVCHGALEVCGIEKTVEEIIQEVLKDKAFYDNSGGGITLSGGEPLVQTEFAKQLLIEAKNNGLNTCLETCGYTEWKNLEEILPFVDTFLWDYKESDEILHKRYTGVYPKLILDNLRKLNERGAKIVLRCPIIPTFNDRVEHFEAIGKLAQSLDGIIRVEVQPYHPLGKDKSKQIGKKYPLEDLPWQAEKYANEWVEQIAKHTNKKVIKN